MKFVLVVFFVLSGGEWRQGPASVYETLTECSKKEQQVRTLVIPQITRGDPRIEYTVSECIKLRPRILGAVHL